MTEFLRIIEGLMNNSVSAVFSILILSYLVLSVIFIGINSSNKKIKSLTDLAPTALTTLGILGTFTGIFLGLLDFDIRNIPKSVPSLIEGLKVAFGTSILGLFSALTFKLLRPLLTSQEHSGEVTGEDLLNALSDVSIKIEAGNKTSEEGFNSLKKALSDDSDSSVAGQLQRLRASFSDLEKVTQSGFEAQIKEFRDFAEHMSKAFSEAIIDELKSVIREFNEKISEQFGDNFKQLNSAVGKLLEWQENYKNQMEEMRSTFEKTVDALSSTTESISKVEQATASIPQHMQSLSEANDTLISQLSEMHEGLSSISKMRENAEGAFPEISNKIEEVTTSIKVSAEIQQEVVEAIKASMSDVSAEMQSSVQLMGKEISTSLSEQREAQQQMLDGVQQALNETLQSATNHLNDAVVQLDEAMQKEIESVVRTMAESLSGVTQKFVSDYSPLLEQTRKIVELSNKAQSK